MERIVLNENAKRLLRAIKQGEVPSEIAEKDIEDANVLIQENLIWAFPDELEKHASDDVFQETFWSNISQVGQKTPAFIGDSIDVDSFMRIPIQEPITLMIESCLKPARKKNGRSI